MALSQIKDSGARAVFIMCLVTGPVCIIAAILRFVATRRIGRQHGPEDWFAYAAVVIHLIYIATCLDALAQTNGRPILDLSGGELLYITKLYYAVPPLFIVNQVFSKTSILLFYHRIFGIKRIWNRWIYGIGVITLLWAIGVLPLFLFSCRPISRGWDLSEPGVCLSYPATVAGAETINSGIDFMMVVLAWFMIRPLHVLIATKLKLGVILAVAGLAGIIGLVKIGQTYTFSEQAVRYRTGLWAIIQMACSIICCCAPTYKPILPSNDFLERYIMPGSRSRYSNSVPSGATLTKHESRAENKRQSISRHWMKIEDSGPSVTAWAEVQPHRGQPSLEAADLAMNTIQVHSTVDVVY